MRDGVAPSYLWLPEGQWPDMLSFLLERYPQIGAAQWLDRMARGEVLNGDGAVLGPGSAYKRGMRIFYYRELEHETPIPFQEEILFQDEHLVVVDKPHFLPMTPAGRFVQETLLTRLKKSLDCAELTPIHRLDRETAGVVIFSRQVASRGAYQTLFQRREVRKTYEALAPVLAGRDFPFTYRSRMVEGEQFFLMREEAGESEFGNRHRRNRAARRGEPVPLAAAHGAQAPAARAPGCTRYPHRQRRVLPAGPAVQGRRHVAPAAAAGARHRFHGSFERRAAPF